MRIAFIKKLLSLAICWKLPASGDLFMRLATISHSFRGKLMWRFTLHELWTQQRGHLRLRAVMLFWSPLRKPTCNKAAASVLAFLVQRFHHQFDRNFVGDGASWDLDGMIDRAAVPTASIFFCVDVAGVVFRAFLCYPCVSQMLSCSCWFAVFYVLPVLFNRVLVNTYLWSVSCCEDVGAFHYSCSQILFSMFVPFQLLDNIKSRRYFQSKPRYFGVS